jgi:hypothetical protein
MLHKIQFSFHASGMRAPTRCERILTCPTKRSDWKKFIFERSQGPINRRSRKFVGIKSGERTLAACWFRRSAETNFPLYFR